MQHDYFLKKIKFDLLIPSPGVVGGGGAEGLQARYCNLVAAFVIPFNLYAS